MVIRVHEADSNGPIAGSGEVFRGGALDVVQGMMLNPFNASLRPVEYMRKTLRGIGLGDVALPEDAEAAAAVFIGVLIKSGYATLVD